MEGVLEEVGSVVELRRGKALVRLKRSEECAGCQGCAMMDQGGDMMAEVDNPLGATPGDTVRVETAGGEGKVKAALLLYGFPLLMMLLGAIGGGPLFKSLGLGASSEIFSVLGALVLLFTKTVPRKITSGPSSVWGNLKDGVIIIGKNQVVRILMMMAIVCEILGFSYQVLLPVFARDILNVGAIGLGMFNTVQAVGGLLAGLSLASLGNYPHKGRLMLGIFLLFGIFLILFAQSPWYSTSLLLVGIVGAIGAAFDSMQHIMLQLNVTDEQRGRAMGIWQLCMGFGPVGHLSVGAIAVAIGSQLTLSINGVAIIVLFFLVLVLVPRLRKI